MRTMKPVSPGALRAGKNIAEMLWPTAADLMTTAQNVAEIIDEETAARELLDVAQRVNYAAKNGNELSVLLLQDLERAIEKAKGKKNGESNRGQVHL